MPNVPDYFGAIRFTYPAINVRDYKGTDTGILVNLPGQYIQRNNTLIRRHNIHKVIKSIVDKVAKTFHPPS